MFQFHKGSIRTFHARSNQNYHYRFNSIKVQLEHLRVKQITINTITVSIP